jgi:ribosome-binding protein aMBF1 (putative translation factor)
MKCVNCGEQNTLGDCCPVCASFDCDVCGDQIDFDADVYDDKTDRRMCQDCAKQFW